MIRLMVFLLLAITLNVAVGMTFRHKRQSSDDSENNLDDRYGWDRPSGDRPRRPWSRPNQGNQWGQPNQGGDQWGQPNQGGNQWGQTNQGGNQGGQPNQGGNQWGQPNQGWGQQNQGGNQQPNQGGNQGNQPTPAPNGTGSTTQTADIQECIRSCPVTPEYNPVCGTNQVQYNNPGRLECARTCGVNVGLQRAGPCAAAAASTS